MAKAITLVDRKATALSDSEKAQLKAHKAILAILRSGDKSTFTAFVNTVNAVDGVLNQTGDGEGKRFSNSRSHEFADNVAAYADTVIRGNLPRIA